MADTSQPPRPAPSNHFGDDDKSSRSSSPGIAFQNVFSDTEGEEAEEEEEEEVLIEEAGRRGEVLEKRQRQEGDGNRDGIEEEVKTLSLDLNESPHRHTPDKTFQDYSEQDSPGSETPSQLESSGTATPTIEASEHSETDGTVQGEFETENAALPLVSGVSKSGTDTILVLPGSCPPLSQGSSSNLLPGSPSSLPQGSSSLLTQGRSTVLPHGGSTTWPDENSQLGTNKLNLQFSIAFSHPSTASRTHFKITSTSSTISHTTVQGASGKTFHQSLSLKRDVAPDLVLRSKSKSFDSHFDNSRNPSNIINCPTASRNPQHKFQTGSSILQSDEANLDKEMPTSQFFKDEKELRSETEGYSDSQSSKYSFKASSGDQGINSPGGTELGRFSQNSAGVSTSLKREGDTVDEKLGTAPSSKEPLEDVMSDLDPVTVWDGQVVSDEEEFPPLYLTCSPKKTGRRVLMPRKRGMYGRSTMTMTVSPLTMIAMLAKRQQTDVAYLLENASELGCNMNFPCFQCYEKMDTSGDYGTDDGYSPLLMDGDMFGAEEVAETRCKRCGGQLVTLASFGKMLREMRKTCASKGLVPHDVYPDGNCLFSTVADQLRVGGEFRFTTDRLRKASVEHLRRNPCAEDGTPYQMFLSDESWDQYLERMSTDGVWGDHLVLNALANILKRRIIIYGGTTGQNKTVINPKGHSYQTNQGDGQKKVKDDAKGQGQKNGADSKGDNPDNHLKSEGQFEGEGNGTAPGGNIQEGEQSEGQGRKNDQEAEGEGHSHGEESGVKGAEVVDEAEEEDDERDILLGHVGESHYLSLRRKDWKSKLLKLLKTKTEYDNSPEGKERKRRRAESGCKFDDKHVDKKSALPLPHISYLLRQIAISKTIVTDCPSRVASGFEATILCEKKTKIEMVGNPYDNLHPMSFIETVMPDLSAFFPHTNIEIKPAVKPVEVTVFLSPEDTHAIQDEDHASAKPTDLLMETITDLGPGFVQLVPVQRVMWKGKMVEVEGGRKVLKPFTVRSPVPVGQLYWPGDKISPPIKAALAFACVWPRVAEEWESRERPSKWPCPSLVKEVVREGCSIIPLENALVLEENKATCDQEKSFLLETFSWQLHPKESVWVVSFEGAVNALSRSLSEEQRVAFFIFKMFLDYWMKEDDILPMSVIESIFFRACERYDGYLWRTESARCFLGMLTLLHSEFHRGQLPSYFMSERNLLRHVSQERLSVYCSKLDMLRSHFSVCLYFFMDFYKLLESELVITFDTVMEDIFRFAKHGDPMKSLKETFIPLSNQAILDHVLNGDYKMAEQALLELAEETSFHPIGGEEPPLTYHFRTAIPDSYVGYKWWFAFYLDAMHKTSLTEEVCHGRETVPIVNLFGPDFVETFGPLNIPAGFEWELMFAREGSLVLKEINNRQVTCSALRFCVEFFGESYPYLIHPNASIRAESGYGSTVATQKTLLWFIYLDLFYAYYYLEKEEEFRDCLDVFERLSKSIGTQTAYSNLANVYYYLGDRQKYNEFRQHVRGDYSNLSSTNTARQSNMCAFMDILS